MSNGDPAPVAATSGYALAFRTGAVLLLVGGVLVSVFLERVQSTPRRVELEMAVADEPTGIA
jgi:hypothetical protein